MYESYWHLARKPFAAAWTPGAYYPSESHHGALLKLKFGVEHGCGAVVLTGITGTGKSMLVDQLLANLPDTLAPRMHAVFPRMPADDLIAHVAGLLGVPCAPTAPLHQQISELQSLLAQNARSGRRAVLAIDEAHLVREVSCLEVLRLLMNFASHGESDLRLILVGQPQLLANLAHCPGLEERMGVKCLLRPFSLEDTASYISHRLTMAGAANGIFAAGAVERVHQLSGGVPGRINRLCDLALLVGFAEEASMITPGHIDAVAEEMVSIGDLAGIAS